MKDKSENNSEWICEICSAESDPLYFFRGKRVCEKCKKNLLKEAVMPEERLKR